MNLVRGVAGLLRRSSSTSVGSLPQEQKQPPFETSAWPEFEFRSDDTDEQVLGSLWKRYKELSDKAEAECEAEQVLADFLTNFVNTYETWIPEELVVGASQSTWLKENCIILGCKSGHPSAVIVDLTYQIRTITKEINALPDLTDEEISHFNIHEREKLLHALAIMTRSIFNRQVFRSSQGLQVSVSLMKASVLQLKSFIVTLSKEETPSSRAGQLLMVLQGLLIHTITIMSHFIQAVNPPAIHKLSGDLDSVMQLNLENSEDQSRNQRRASFERFGPGGAILLMEMGGLNWFVELLRIAKMLRMSGTSLDSALEHLTLTTLKAALSENLRAQNHFRSLGGVDVLIDAIGTTSTTMQGDTDSKERCSSRDFQIQVLALQVLREAVFRNLSNLEYLVDKGGTDKCIRLLVWAGFILPTQTTHETEMNKENIQGYNLQVSQVCQVVWSFLLASGDIRGFATGLYSSNEASVTANTYWELATRWIIRVLLGIFKNLEILQASRMISTTLQHYTLYAFKKMLAVSPRVLKAFRTEGVWDVMFSEHFFYFEMDSRVPFTKEHLQWPSDAMLSEESFDSEPLRLEVISFVELAATASIDTDNGPECYALMKALENCAVIPSVATMIVKSLHRVLQLAPDQTVRAFKNLEALLLLSQVMEKQLQEFIKVSNSSVKQLSVEDTLESEVPSRLGTSKEGWKLAREAVFDLFAEYVLTSEEARIVFLHSARTVQVLFDLLWDEESRRFALKHILDVMKLPPTSKEDQEAKLELCIKYLETLSRSSHEGKPEDMDVVIDMLSGIREILETDYAYYQALFQEAQCFVHIVSLLNENLPEQHGKHLCLSVLQTLRHLLLGNAASKKAFRSLVGAGYTTLQTLLMNRHEDAPTEELLRALLDMLVDGDFNIPENMTILNEDVIILFFTILRQACEALQLFGLLTFNRILLESTANRATCVITGLLSYLLDWFGAETNNNLITKLAMLIEAIGQHSVTGKDMRKVFSLLRNANQLANSAHRKILLNVVQGMLQEEGPAAFFEMSGKESGITLTTPLRLPSVKGFTLSCWIRVKLFPVTDNRPGAQDLMSLFTFLTESGKGYNAMIGQDRLVVEILGQKKLSAVLKVQVLPKRWCHLCISHTIGRALTGGATLRVYIDGCLAASQKLRYPKINESLSKGALGTQSHPSQSEGLLDMTSAFPFCGQLGAIYLFDDSLSGDQIMAAFQAGPRYMFSFQPTEVGSIPKNVAAHNIFDAKEGLSSKLVFGFNAKASFGQKIFDVASSSDSISDKGPHEAVIMAGTQLCYRRLLKEILDCVGGVGVFFPLLTQLDQSQSSMDKEALINVNSLSTSNVYVAAEVIELIALVLENSASHQQYMLKNKGMSIIGFLLQSVSPQHLTTGVASALVHLLSIVRKTSETSLSKQLIEETLLNIFLNLHIWIYTPYTVQREVLMALLNYCESEVGLAQDHIRLPKLLDLVQQFYWDKATSRKSVGIKRLLHPVSKEVIGERPGREEVGKLRILLLSLAEIVLRDSISMPDTKALVAFVDKSEDPVCLEDVLHMLLRLLGRKQFATDFVENLQVLGGFQLFLSLLERQEEPLRLLGLQIIGLLLMSVPNEKKGSWLLSLATGVTRTAYENQRSERAKLTSLFSAMTERLVAFPFTDLVCATLFDVLLGGASLKQVLQRGTGITQKIAGQRDLTSSSQFALPQVLGTLMRFVLNCENSETRFGIMRDVFRLLEANPSSSEAVLLEPSWQCWLFDLLVKLQNRRANTEIGNDVSVNIQEEELVVYGIFTIIHFFCIYRVRGGWKQLEKTATLVHIYSEQGFFDNHDLLHRLYGDLLEALLEAHSQENVLMPQPYRDNTLYMLNLLAELLSTEIIQILPFPKDEEIESIHETSGQPSSGAIMEEKSSDTGEHLFGMRSQEAKKGSSPIKDEYWQIYDKLWALMRYMHGRVVAGGFGAVVSLNPVKLIDKAVKLRGETFPRILFHLVLLYIYRGSLEAASSCVHQFLSYLPLLLSTESEQCRNRLQLLLWCLVEARSQLALMDDGARFHLISQLIRETVEHGRNMIAATVVEKDDSNGDTASVQGLLQQDRIINAVKEEKAFHRSALAERSSEVSLLKSEMKEMEEAGKANLKFLEEQLQSALLSLRSSESSRTATVEMSYEEDQQSIQNQWCHMFRHLTDERGPWSTIQFPNKLQVSWKLDKTEDPCRRRLKLRRNYNFDEWLTHPQECSEASLISLPLSAKVASFDSLLETSKLLLKGLRGISEEESADLEDEEDDYDKPQMGGEASLESSSNETSELAFAKGEEILNKTPVGTRGQELPTEPVAQSSVCVLVTPKRKLAGRLEIGGDSLHFYGDFLVEGTAGSSVFTSSGQINGAEHISLDIFEKGGNRESSKEHANLEPEKSNAQDRLDGVQSAVSWQRGLKNIKRHHRWDLLKVKAVHGTRYLLQHTAVEIFFESSIAPIFLNFPSQTLAKEVGLKILSLRNTLLVGKGNSKEKIESNHFVDKNMAVELAHRYHDLWQRRNINNFEYLMHLNTLSGRSYNDLTQYPVFPWILSDYTSEVLDLSSPSSFRDLSKPVGALNEKRFQVFKERFHNFSDPEIPSFYYGSHYSSMGIVLFYLLRLEPFTSLHRNLQGGKFDHADRLFHSIEGTFRNCLANTSDVKELIPEFFYLPEFLANSNGYYLGIKQDGERLDNVVLPRWAKGSPEEFILKNREALESEHVSQHLHQWIDLIFGYRQSGKHAEEAANVFFHLTYEEKVDLESFQDRLQRAAVEDQIANFGQTPMKLFRKKHPRRGPVMPITRPLYYAPGSITLTSSIPATILSPLPARQDVVALPFVSIVDNKLVLVTSGLNIVVRNWLTASQSGGSFTFSSSQEPFFSIGSEVLPPCKIRGPFAETVDLNPWCFRAINVRTSSYLLSCGFWDNSFRVISLADGSLMQTNRHHKDVVSCLAVSSDGIILVTGSHDTTVMVWEIDRTFHSSKKSGHKDAANATGKGVNVFFSKPRHVLSGHDDIVTCVAVSTELDLVMSGSRDSSCIIHTLRAGRYVQSIQHPLGSSISQLVVSKHGLAVLFSKDDLIFFLYSINGKHLASVESHGCINCMDLSSCGEFLVCGGDQGHIMVRSIYTLQVLKRYEGTNTPILSLSVTSEDCFLAGLLDGGLLIYSIERPQHKKLTLLQSLGGRSS